jgi:hypothetical protein
MRALQKVISGGQTGVDQAALRAAKDCGLEIGGWCPPGRACETGSIPPEFPLQETPEERSPDAPEVPRSQRTKWNVRDSDGTLVLRSHERSGFPTSPGTEWTIACAARYERALLVLEIEDPEAKGKIERWLAGDSIKTLNVAGRSEGTAPGIGESAYGLLKEIFATANEKRRPSAATTAR